jgi:hypothetical protein
MAVVVCKRLDICCFRQAGPPGSKPGGPNHQSCSYLEAGNGENICSNLLGRTNLEHLGATCAASAGSGRLAVLHGNGGRVLHLFLGFTLYAVGFHDHVTPSMV